jgi:hypothetical protein
MPLCLTLKGSTAVPQHMFNESEVVIAAGWCFQYSCFRWSKTIAGWTSLRWWSAKWSGAFGPLRHCKVSGVKGCRFWKGPQVSGGAGEYPGVVVKQWIDGHLQEPIGCRSLPYICWPVLIYFSGLCKGRYHEISPTSLQYLYPPHYAVRIGGSWAPECEADCAWCIEKIETASPCPKKIKQ